MTPLFDAARAIEAIRSDPLDDDAWTVFYSGFRRQILGTLALRGIRDRDVREELCAEVFFRFLRYSPWRADWFALPDAAVVGAYLRTTAHNVAMTWRGDVLGEPMTEPAEPVIESAETSVLSIDLLNRLEPKEREFLHAYIRNDFSLAAVAEELRITYSTAGTRLYRIRQHLREISGFSPRSR